MKKQTELPEIIKTYIKGFARMGILVAALSVVALVMHFKEL